MAKTKITKRKHKDGEKASRNAKDPSKNRTKKQKTVSSNMGTSSLEEREGRKFAYSGKQMKTWKVMDRQMREYLENIIDSSIKLVLSRSQFASNREVQESLSDASRVLKSKLRSAKVPKSRYGTHGKLKETLLDLQEELERNAQHKEELHKAIRAEEREIERLEDIRDSTEVVTLDIQVPENQLQLPQII